MYRKFCQSILTILVFLAIQNFAYALPQNEAEFRNWKSANGKFSVEAKLLSHDDETVKLETRKGKTLVVEISKLGKADKSHIRTISSSTVKRKSKGRVAKFSARTDKSAIGNIPINAGISFRSKLPRLKPLKFRADFSPAKTLNFPLGRIDSAGPPVKIKEENWLDSWAISINQQYLATTVSNPATGKAWAFVYDLAEGDVSDPLLLPWEQTRVLSIASDGKSLLTSSSSSKFGSRSDLWSVEDEKLNHSKGWSPSSAFKSALLIDNQKVLSGFDLVVWDLQTGFDDCRRLGKVLHRSGHLALSPDQKYIAVANARRLHIFSTVGRHEGTLGRPDVDQEIEADFGEAAFSPSGKFLAVSSGQKVTIWELEKGKVVDQFPILDSGCLAWTNDQYIFSGGALYDTKLHALVWRYDVAVENLVPLSDGRFVLVGPEGVRIFEFPEVDPDGTRFGSLDRDQLRVIRAGQRIRLDLSDLKANDVPQSENIRKLWEARLTSYGMKVHSGVRGDRLVRFEFNRLRSKTATVRMQPFPFVGVGSNNTKEVFWAFRKPPKVRSADPFDHPMFTDRDNYLQSRIGKEVQYRPSIGKIKLLVKGEVAWQAAHKFKPSSNVLMVLGERDSIQHHVDQACLPNPLFYATHFVPIGLSTVPKNLIGESKITLDGIN